MYSLFVAAILFFAAGAAVQAQDITTPGTKATGGGGGGRTTAGGRTGGGRTTGGRTGGRAGGRTTGGRTGGRTGGAAGAAAAGGGGGGGASASGVNMPANNNFRSAQFISGPTGSVIGRNINANHEPGEPGHVSSTSGGTASIWYRWVAPATGSVQFTTAGSTYDTLLAVYAGSSVNSLSVVANNDDINNTLQSAVTFNAIAGTTYYIAVDGFNGAEGNVALSWRMGVPIQSNNSGGGGINTNDPSADDATDAGGNNNNSGSSVVANDNVINAIALQGRSGRIVGTNVGATREAGEPNHAERQGSASVHYRWVAPANGRVTFTTAGSSFDTLLAVYTVSNNGVTTIASNDDSNGLQSVVTFNAVAGTVYIISIDGYGNATGQIVLNWNY